MTKKYLYISISLNLILLVCLVIMCQSNNLNSVEMHRIDNVRLADIKSLETLILGRISKGEAINILKASSFKSDFFIKSDKDENGVGVSSLFLRFNRNNQLDAVEASSFEGS